MAIATSIDALFAGMGIALLSEAVLVPAIVIDLVTALLSYAGVYAGRFAGHIIGEYAEIADGA